MPNEEASTEFNVDSLNEKFKTLIRGLGINNRKGTLRYQFEVDFAYALNELDSCPAYLKGKMYDKASNILSSLITTLRNKDKEPKAAAAA